MQEFTVILMLRRENGVMERELCGFRVTKNGGFLRNMYVTEKPETEEKTIHMFLTTDRDTADWEFQAVYDHYDMGVFDGLGLSIDEAPGDDNPTWEIRFPYLDGAEKLADKTAGILNIHKRELGSVFETIKDVEGEYNAVREV